MPPRSIVKHQGLLSFGSCQFGQGCGAGVGNFSLFVHVAEGYYQCQISRCTAVAEGSRQTPVLAAQRDE